MYKIHFNQSAIYILQPSEIESYKNSSFLTSKEINVDITYHLLSNFLEGKIEPLIIAHDNPKFVVEKLKQKLTYIEAAGGVVQNEFNEILIIDRLNKYDLPKGKCEPDESIEQTALREVEEECGVTDLQIVEQLLSTYHIYKHKQRHILKQTYWFRMKTHKQKLTPQKAENIRSAQWMGANRKNEILANTYPTLESHINNAFNY